MLAEPKNSKDIADKLLLLLKDEEKRRSMGQAAAQRAKEHFSWNSVGENYFKTYQEVMNE